MADQQSGTQDPDAIRRDIEETRVRMERNIHALQNKLDPERLKTEAKSTLREQTVGRIENFADNATETVKGTGEDVFESIKQNPLPAALAAIGLGWLFMESRNTARMHPARRFASDRTYGERYYADRNDRYGYDRDYQGRGGQYSERGMTERVRDNAGQMADQARGTVRNAANSVTDTASDFAGNVGDKASRMANDVSDTASQVVSNVSDTASEFAGNVGDKASRMASDVSDTASHVASNVSDTAGQMADMAQRGAHQAKTRFQEVMEDSPLLIGAAALALGAAIGMSLPHTEKEDQLIGEMRDSFMDKAQDQAKTTMDKVQQVAERAGDAAKDAAQDEAEKQKLTS